MVRTTVVGSYPRIGDAPEEQKLRRAIARFEEGKIDGEQLREVERETIRDVVREQLKAGISLVADGQVTWYDSQSHFARRLAGFEIDGLVRYFDTNTYYRQPVRTGPARWNEPIVLDDWRTAQGAGEATPAKAIMTGPYTLASLAKLGGARVCDVALELATALSREVSALASAGAKVVQVDEPALVRRPEDIAIVAETTARLSAAKGSAALHLFTSFGDVASVWDDLTELPVDNLGVDLVQGEATLKAIRRLGSPVPLTLGLVDARNTRREDPRAVAKTVVGLRDRIPLADSYLAPSNGLEFLPRANAREKLAIVVEAAKVVGEAA